MKVAKKGDVEDKRQAGVFEKIEKDQNMTRARLDAELRGRSKVKEQDGDGSWVVKRREVEEESSSKKKS